MKAIHIKVMLVALLVGVAGVGYAQDTAQFSLLLLAFGILNVIVTPHGTDVIRGVTVAVSSVGLAVPGMSVSILPFVGLLWPPAFLIAWSAGQPADAPDVDPVARRRSRIGTAVLIASVAIGAMAFHAIRYQRLEQTSALFIGIPTLLAIVVVFAVSPRSAAGVACKAVTIGLLISLLALGEGVVCILMSAPLFYGIAVLFAKAVEIERNRGGHKAYSFALILLFVPMSLEGVFEWTSLSRDEWVTETRVVHASSVQVEEALFQTPRFDRVLPAYLRIGFPRPISTRVEPDGDAWRWVVRFRGGEMRLDGIEPRAGDLILELVDRQPGLVRWRALGDDSHMTHFLNWRESIVQWTPVDAHSTRVTWTLRYRRGLDPAWYFGPWERYATRLAAGYLIETVATP